MRVFITFTLFLGAFSVSAVRVPLTPDQLRREADQICYGSISSIQQQRHCHDRSCTDYTINSVAELHTISCQLNGSSVITGRFYKHVYAEPIPDDYGHDPQPQIGQLGTMYLRNGNIVHPNGWVPIN